MNPIAPVDPVSANLVLDHATARPQSLDVLAESFNRLMHAQPPQPAQHDPAAVGAGSPVGHFIGAQEAVMRETFASVRDFSVQAPSMNPGELAARHIELSYQLAAVQVQFNAGVYVSQSGKSGLQTLMKNQ